MRALIRSHRARSFLALFLAALVAGWWLYWNRSTRNDMASYAPADCLAFVEANDLAEIAQRLEGTRGWQALAGPVGARATLSPNRWFIRLARWTGLGSTEAVLLARSQIAIIFTGVEAGPALTVKPLATLVIETHTTQRRMRPILERHVEEIAQRFYGQPVLSRKQVDDLDLTEWSSADGSRQIVAAFVDTVAFVGNDEPSVIRCLEARRGKRGALAAEKQLEDLRKTLDAPSATVFGFVSKPGVKKLLQAF